MYKYSLVEICFQFLGIYQRVRYTSAAGADPIGILSFHSLISLLYHHTRRTPSTHLQCKNMIIVLNSKQTLIPDPMSAVKDGLPIIGKQLAIRLSLFKQIAPKLFDSGAGSVVVFCADEGKRQCLRLFFASTKLRIN